MTQLQYNYVSGITIQSALRGKIKFKIFKYILSALVRWSSIRTQLLCGEKQNINTIPVHPERRVIYLGMFLGFEAFKYRYISKSKKYCYQ